MRHIMCLLGRHNKYVAQRRFYQPIGEDDFQDAVTEKRCRRRGCAFNRITIVKTFTFTLQYPLPPPHLMRWITPGDERTMSHTHHRETDHLLHPDPSVSHSRKGDLKAGNRAIRLANEIREYLNKCRRNGVLPNHKYCTLLQEAECVIRGGRRLPDEASPNPVPGLSKVEGRTLFILANERRLLSPCDGDQKTMFVLQDKDCVDEWFAVTALGRKALDQFIQESK